MPAYYNEFEPFAAQWLRNLIDAGHLPPGDVDSRSLLDVQPEDLIGYEQCHFFAGIGIWGYALRRIGWADDSPIWSGSCPCQPFSAAGGRLGFDDERHLWPAWYQLIAQREPTRIVGEQVASKDGLEWLDLVSTDLENAEYAFAASDLCAAGFSEQGSDRGGFHLRQRFYFVATREGLDDPAGARHEGAQRDAKGDSWDQARLRVPSERGAFGELGDAPGERRRETRNEYRRDEQAERDNRAGDRGGLADGTGARLEGYGQSRKFVPTGSGPESSRQNAVCGGGGGGLADSDEQGIGGRGIQGCEQSPSAGAGFCEDSRTRFSGMADAERTERGAEINARRDFDGYPSERGEIANCGAQRGGNPMPVDGVADGRDGVFDNGPRRANANLVYCRDGRWRPVEPGAFPLAYAVPRSMAAMRPELRAVCAAAGFGDSDLKEARLYRSGALKAFGNALDAETVVAFLEAALPLAP